MNCGAFGRCIPQVGPSQLVQHNRLQTPSRLPGRTALQAAPPVAEPTTSAAVDAESKTTSQPKVWMQQLGCAKNTVDGEVMLGDLHSRGYQVTADAEAADVLMINTCAFIEDAKTESINAILEAAALKAEGSKLVVTGCLAQRYGAELAEGIPEADIIMGMESYSTLPETLQQALNAGARSQPASTSGRVHVGAATVPFREEWNRHRLTPKHTAYLRVAEGCNHACSFCSIPSFRGKFRSKPWQPLIDEARHLVASGVKELNLIAEDTNQYGQDRRDGRNLAELLRELSKIEGLHWMRLLYCYPSYWSDDLIDEIANNPKVCKGIDMPLQHIDNMMLLSMNRPPRAHTDGILRKLRERIPDLALRTTFITGFPGETQEQHDELVRFCRQFKFERMGAFTYSQEDGTAAFDREDQVDEDTRAERRDELVALQQGICASFAESLVGREIDVLVDAFDEDAECLIGRTQWDAPDVDPHVLLSDAEPGSGIAPLELGQMRRCKVIGTSFFDLEAYPVC